MTYTSTITTKGQVTIPIDIRKFFKVKPGDLVVFKKNKNTVTIEPHTDILEVAGSLSKYAIKGKTLQQIIDIEHKALEEAIVQDYSNSNK